jgi:hypothetical protein
MERAAERRKAARGCGSSAGNLNLVADAFSYDSKKLRWISRCSCDYRLKGSVSVRGRRNVEAGPGTYRTSVQWAPEVLSQEQIVKWTTQLYPGPTSIVLKAYCPHTYFTAWC